MGTAPQRKKCYPWPVAFVASCRLCTVGGLRLHASLWWLQNFRVARWFKHIADYDFKVVLQHGQKH
ncbi:hypothetical protein T07_4032 [Trichinella nelsoni]|uniref:Uncharacterized protein n=1 Tax=Trichinella nelsoni TaxID=6336 RepID=A0A0V0SG39_9BILA|nr:hypothetical protein T07_4032 [Trichinella nelsoni]